MEHISDFFDVVDEYAIFIFAYDDGEVLYMNQCAIDKENNKEKGVDYLKNIDTLRIVLGNEKKKKIRITPSKDRVFTGTLYRTEYKGRDAVIAYMNQYDENKGSAGISEVVINVERSASDKAGGDFSEDELAVIDGMYDEYFSVIIVNARTDSFTVVHTNDNMNSYMRSFTSYDKMLADYCKNYISGRDIERVRELASLKKVIETLKIQSTYQIMYQMADQEWRALRFMRLKGSNNRIIAGVVSFDKDMQDYLTKKSVEEILNSISEDFQALYRVNLNTEKLEVMSVNLDEKDIVYATKDNFMHEEVYRNIYVDPFFREEYKEKVSHSVLKEYFRDNDKHFTYYYREISGKWINMKVIKDLNYSDDNPYVVYAIKECKDEMEDEIRNLISKTALSKVFEASLVIDMEEDTYDSLYDSKEFMTVNKKGKFSDLLNLVQKKIFEEDFPVFKEMFENRDFADGFVEREFRASDQNGETHFYSGMTTNVKLHDGYKMLFLVMNNDERVESRASLISLNKEYDMTRNVLYTLGDDYFGMYYFDFDAGNIKTLRLPVDMCDVFEASSEIDNFTSIYINQMVHPDDRDAIANCFSRDFIDSITMSGKDNVFCEFRRLVDGEYRWIRLDIRVIKIVNGHTMEAVYAMKDISDEREMELKRNKELMDAIVAANRANQAKSLFLSNMSHDIRTPLNAIIGMTDIALNHIDNSQRVYANLQKIKSSGRILLYLINNILDMSYIESGKVVINETPISLAELFHNVVTMVQPKVRDKHLTFRARAKDVDNEIVLSDQSTLNKIIINLLGNAIKYTNDYGEIGLSLEQIKTENEDISIYRITISDTGIGMTEEFVEKMFEPFEREKDTTMSGVEGTGLGMSITKQLVDLMNGKIYVRSEQNVGTVFTVEIPLKHAADSKKKDITYDENDFRIFYIENDGLGVINNIRNYAEKRENKEIVVVTSYDKDEFEEELEKAGVTKYILEPVFKSDLQNVLGSTKGSKKIKRSTKNPLKGKKILIVEDNLINIDIISDYLDDVEVVYDSVKNGLEAYNKILVDQSYDCILMDIRMPVMGGYEATKKIREIDSEYAKNVPIIAMTANAFAEDVQMSKSMGMNDHITKPVNIEVFYSVIKKHIVGE